MDYNNLQPLFIYISFDVDRQDKRVSMNVFPCLVMTPHPLPCENMV